MPITTPAIQALLGSFSFTGSVEGVGVCELVGSEVCEARLVPAEAGLAVVSVKDESEELSEEIPVEIKSVLVASPIKVPAGTSR